ncbi:hypothetical protein F5B20DRAFT_585831 [Whalleya microplaca]|nr:hypothetical protein F5B20DRAFT_585831 [Whalleya microplaca]
MITPLIALKLRATQRLARERKPKQPVSNSNLAIDMDRDHTMTGALPPTESSAPAPNPKGKAPETTNLQRNRPAQLRFAGLREKVPFESRANPFIDKTHPKFLEIEKYFSSLLRETRMTVQEILETNFEYHEIELFTPATQPAELVAWQKDNAVRYQRLLETRFNGHMPSLQLKMAFLYFGLPVAPMKPGAIQVHSAMDLDFGEDEVILDADPLQFLEEYTERTYGNSEAKTTYKDYMAPRTQTFTSLTVKNEDPITRFWDENFTPLGLRGGGLEEQGGGSHGPKPQRPSHPAAGSYDRGKFPFDHPLRVFGYQGMNTVQGSYQNFVQAVDRLLTVKYGWTYDVCFEVWDMSTVETKPVDEVTGKLYHMLDLLPAVDPIISTLVKWFMDPGNAARYAFFVRFTEEAQPAFYTPVYEVDRYIVRLWDDDAKSMAYMKVPRNLHPAPKSNQFQAEYQRAIKVLFSENPHKYLQFNDAGGRLSYGYLDPPPETWKTAVQNQQAGGELPLVSFKHIDIPWDKVPILIPGFHDDVAGSRRYLERKDLKVNGQLCDRTGFKKMVGLVLNAHGLAECPKELTALDIWITPDDFLNLHNDSDRIPIQNIERSLPALQEWRAVMAAWQSSRIHGTFDKVSIVARPVYQSYTIRAKQGQKSFSVDIDRVSLDGFTKEIRSKVFPDYDPANKQHVLHLVQGTRAVSKVDFAITSETDEIGWAWIVRHITEQDIVVSLEHSNNEWVVDGETTWGPRYDRLDVTKLSTFEVPKPKAYSSEMNSLFQNSSNTQRNAVRSVNLRERFFWDNPSIFTNPTKPGMPINGPPIESIIKTGPSMPGVTIAMRTPTEVARLQREVHTLRGQLLDRIRECPYTDCGRYFKYSDGAELDRHLREDHRTVQCFLCSKKEHLLPYYSGDLIRQHFIDVHFDEFRQLFGDGAAGDSANTATTTQTRGELGKPTPPSSSFIKGRPSSGRRGPPPPPKPVSKDENVKTPVSRRFDFCSRCGRDQDKLSAARDRVHHMAGCDELDENVDRPEYCIDCGAELRLVYQDSGMGRFVSFRHPCTGCGKKVLDVKEPGQYCRICGIYFDYTMDQAYQEVHRANCRPLGGDTSDYCKVCGLKLMGMSDMDRTTHAYTHNNPSGQRGESNRSSLASSASSTGGQDSSAQPSVLIKCKKCEQRFYTVPEAMKHMEFYHNRRDEPPLWRAAVKGDVVGRRRDKSPDWERMCGENIPATEPFAPEPHFRCSRCFRCAGEDQREIEKHMNPLGSCKIARNIGAAEGLRGEVGLPNRSGWIDPVECPDWAAKYREFVGKYPAYRYTMFPVRDESVDKVWGQPYKLETAVGSNKDDPNYDGGDTEHDATRSRALPWPPYEGTVIPLDDAMRPMAQRSHALAYPVGDQLDDGGRSYTVEEQIAREIAGSKRSVTGTQGYVRLGHVRGKTALDQFVGDDWDYVETDAKAHSRPVESIIEETAEEMSGLESVEERANMRDTLLRKRKRTPNDPTFTHPQRQEDEPSEEHSEASAVPDPIQNLDPNAPKSPRKRVIKRGGSTAPDTILPKPRKTRNVSGQISTSGAESAGSTTQANPKTPARARKTSAAKAQTPATVTRAGRAVRATRAAMEAEAAQTESTASEGQEDEIEAPPPKRRGRVLEVKDEDATAKTPGTARRGRPRK